MMLAVAFTPLSEKTIHDEETNNVDVAESMVELKVRTSILLALCVSSVRRCSPNLKHSTLQSVNPT